MKLTKTVLKEMVLKELKELTAVRELQIAAQQLALDFEKEILSKLKRMMPDDLELSGQKQYLRIADEFKAAVQAAVAKMARDVILAGIPLQPEKTNKKSSSSSASPPSVDEL